MYLRVLSLRVTADNRHGSLAPQRPPQSGQWGGLPISLWPRRTEPSVRHGAAEKGCSLCCHGYTEARSDAVIFSPAVPIYWWHPGDTQERQEGLGALVLPGVGDV